MIPHGYCHCGCGQRTKIITMTNRKRGLVKGEPRRYLHGHNGTTSGVKYIVDAETGCWVWQRNAVKGYGRMPDPATGKIVIAHRWYYEQAKGPIPVGHHIDHLCRNPSCVNPDHLEAVTPRENWLRSNAPSVKAATKTHCVRGHELTPDNVYPTTNRKHYERACRRCQAERNAKHRAKKLKHREDHSLVARVA